MRLFNKMIGLIILGGTTIITVLFLIGLLLWKRSKHVSMASSCDQFVIK